MKRAFELPECTVCLQLPPHIVYQCFEGHLMCSKCMWGFWNRGERVCPTCRGSLPSRGNRIRNRFAEAVAAATIASCPLCAVEMLHRKLQKHECLETWKFSATTVFGSQVEQYRGYAGKQQLLRIEFLGGEAHGHVRSTQGENEIVEHFQDKKLVGRTFIGGPQVGMVQHVENKQVVRQTYGMRGSRA
jgi:hypothetical protein